MFAHITQHRVTPASTLRTHTTLVAAQVTAHSVNSRFATHANCTTAGDTCLFRAVAGRDKIYLRPSDHFFLIPSGAMTSSTVSPVLHMCNETGNHAETRSGAYLPWRRIADKTGDQYNDVMSKVCDGLRGDAFVAVQEVGMDNLCQVIDGRPSGMNTLINQKTRNGFPLTEHESKELFHQYCCPGGPLSRQSGESVGRRANTLAMENREQVLVTQTSLLLKITVTTR